MPTSSCYGYVACTKGRNKNNGKIIALSTAAFVANIGVNEEYLRDVAKISPSAATLNELVVELAVESVLMTSDTISDKKLGLICDKGEDGGTGDSFVKLMAYYNDREDKVDVTCFGIKNAGNKSDDAAKAIDHALKLF